MSVNIAELFVRLSADNSGLKKGMAEATSSVDKASRSIKSALAQVGIAFGAGAFARALIQNTIEAQKAMAQLAAVVKSTGGAAGKTVPELDAMAQALQRTTTFGDEAIKGAQGLLLTFTQIKGSTFDDATKAVLDLSQAMGGDLKGAAIQVGKALNDPVTGMTALRRVGVSFSAEQKAVIKSLAETGRVAEAQALILKELQVEFGGSAEAARNTLGGALQALNNAWGDQLEISRSGSSGIVAAINGITDALPALRQALDFVVRGWQAVGINAAVAVEQFKLVARALDPRRIWSSDAQAAFEEQKVALDRVTAAAADMMVELNRGAPDAGAGVKTITQNLQEAETAAAKLDERVKQLGASLADLPSAADIFARAAGAPGRSFAQDTLPDAKQADADFMAEAKRRFGGAIQAPAPEAARPSAFVGSAGGGEGVSVFAKVVESLKGFGSAIGGVLSALNPWKFLLEAVQRALGDFLVNMTPIVEILAAAFMPVLKALFPIFKLLAIAATYVGQVFFTIAGGILKAVGYLVKGLGALIAKLPGVGDFGLKKAGQAMIDLGNGFSEASSELGDARDKIRELEWKDAVDPLKEASDEAGEAVKKMAEGLRNVPEIWNANLARFRAAVSAGGAAVGGALTGGRTLAGGGGGVVIPDATFNFYGVQNVAQFRRELEAEVVRTAARGGAPVLVDANRRL